MSLVTVKNSKNFDRLQGVSRTWGRFTFWILFDGFKRVLARLCSYRHICKNWTTIARNQRKKLLFVLPWKRLLDCCLPYKRQTFHNAFHFSHFMWRFHWQFFAQIDTSERRRSHHHHHRGYFRDMTCDSWRDVTFMSFPRGIVMEFSRVQPS